MRFWDSSAIVPLLIEQPASRSCRDLLRSDQDQIAWMLTPTEITSALCRCHRTGEMTNGDLSRAEVSARRLARRWTRIDAWDPVADEAGRLLHRHPLRAADALQLGA